MIGIIDYGAGNLMSVQNALEFLKLESRLVQHPEDAEGLCGLVLPGVGAYGSAMKMLRSTKLDRTVLSWIAAEKPFLGICLGLQLLFEKSEEAPGKKGLGLFKGQVVRFDTGRVPQIGWNQVHARRTSRLLAGPGGNEFYYFLHSYFVRPEDERIVAATTDYGIPYASAVETGNVLAVQFHPEKSGDAGLRLLERWARTCAPRGRNVRGKSGGT